MYVPALVVQYVFICKGANSLMQLIFYNVHVVLFSYASSSKLHPRQ